MSILNFISKVCVQTAVYWGNPVNDGYGGKTFAEPREIKCRWEDKDRVIRADDEKEVLSRSEVLVTEDLDYEGWLFLGLLTDIDYMDSSSNLDVPTNPKDVIGAYEIIAIDRIPLIKSNTKFVRKVYLGFQNAKR